MAKRILWDRKKGEYTYHFYANFKLSDLKDFQPGGEWSDKELEKKFFGKEGLALYKLIRKIGGVDNFSLSAYQLTVSRLAGWKPEEVFPKVVEAIRAVHGDDVVFECKNRVADILCLIQGKLFS